MIEIRDSLTYFFKEEKMKRHCVSMMGFILAAVLFCSCTTMKKSAKDMPVRDFFTLQDGRVAKLYTLSNGKGFEAKVTDMGGALVSLTTVDRNGDPIDVVLGHGGADWTLCEPHHRGELRVGWKAL